MSSLRRAQCILRHLSGLQHQSQGGVLHQVQLQACRDKVVPSLSSAWTSMFSSISSSRSSPALHIDPKSGLADGLLDVRVSGLLPGQLVALQAEVESECQRYKFQSRGMYQADMKGEVIVSEHASLGGTYEGVEPMGLIWSCKPAPDKAHLYPRLKKADASKPLNYTFSLVDRSKSDEEEAVLASEVVERCYLADWVERIPMSNGKSHGVWFIPKQSGSPDLLPVVVELRGVGNGVLEDRASLLAAKGYAVFAMDFLPSCVRGDKDDDDVYFEGQAFLDVFDFIKSHPRLDENRVGVFGFCSGSALAIHGITRLHLPIRCVVFSSMIEVLHSVIGFRMPDGCLIPTLGSIEDFTETYEVDGYTWFRVNSTEAVNAFIADNLVIPEDTFPPVDDISVPSLFILADDDQYQPSRDRMLMVIDAMKEAGKGHLIETLELKGSGHLLDAPYLPICTQSSIKFPNQPKPYFTTWGGTPQPYAHSIEMSWKHVNDFFQQHLVPTEHTG